MSRLPDSRGASPRRSARPAAALVRVAIVIVIVALTMTGLVPAASAAGPRNPPEHGDQPRSRDAAQQHSSGRPAAPGSGDSRSHGWYSSFPPPAPKSVPGSTEETGREWTRRPEQHQREDTAAQKAKPSREPQPDPEQRPDPEQQPDAPASGVPELDWSDCGAELPGLQCATADVPLDYDDPQGRTIQLALARLPAGDPEDRIGSLFVNPGGPGGSGRQFVRKVADTYPPDVAARFDIVGVDPRGTGGSTQVRCADSPADEASFEADYPLLPAAPHEERIAAIRSTQLSVNCWANNFWLLPHLSTANVARDFDLLRQAVGDDRFSFAGISYGTFLGATYAAMFPDRVRALVLDGVVDPLRYVQGGRTPFLRIHSNAAADAAFAEFRRLCGAAGPVRCPFAAGGDPTVKFAQLAARLKVTPIQAGTPEGSASEGTSGGTYSFGYPELIYGTLGALYVPSLWGPWSDALEALYASSDAGAALDLARRTAAAGVAGLTAPVDESQVASLCADTDVPRNPYAFGRIAAAADAETPYFGRLFTYMSSQPCATWLSAGGDRYLGPWSVEPASPALVIGTRHDPATPYRNAATLAGLLGGSALLTLEGWGHTSFGLSGCVNDTIRAYLVDRQLPAAGASCGPDSQPFATSPAAATPADRRDVAPPGPSGRRPLE